MMMDGLIRTATVRRGGGGGGGAAAVDDDMGGDGVQCSDHPYRNSATGGGICAFCLQEKLGKLVSSSSSSFLMGSSSSSSPSFRSAHPAVSGGGSGGPGFGSAATASNASSLSLSLSMAAAAAAASSSSFSGRHHHSHHQRQDGGGGNGNNSRRARILYLLTSHKKKKAITTAEHSYRQPSSAASSSYSSAATVLKRSKSTATPRRRGGNPYLPSDGEDYSPDKRGGFWSFLYPSKPKTEKSSSSSFRDLKTLDITPSKAVADAATGPAASTSTTSAVSVSSAVGQSLSSAKKHNGGGSALGTTAVMVDESADSPNSNSSNATSFGRKVSRSRSVGCGSRSFSGDFFERISTGFGDCTLRRVESQREGKRSAVRGDAIIKERVRCGGIFSTFIMTSSSSSSSSSSYWLSGSTTGGEEHANNHNHPNGSNVKGAAGTPGMKLASTPLVHGRSKSWGWAFASPMRAFGRPSHRDGRMNGNKNSGNNATSTATKSPNLAAIPSLLTVRS